MKSQKLELITHFHARMRAPAKCLPNVLLTAKEFPMDSQGHNKNDAYLECYKMLLKANRKWKYVVNLENHDVQMRTNAEMVQIFKWLGEANDVEVIIEPYPSDIVDRLKHYEQFNWSFEALHLFKDERMNRRLDAQGRPLALRLAKGYLQGSLSRQFVDFLVDRLDLGVMLAQLNQGVYAMDEHWLQMLSTSDALDAPGGFTQRCYENGFTTPYVTRYTTWGEKECHTSHMRHGICLLGVEEIRPILMTKAHLFANKMMPDFDFWAIQCWHEEMRRRSRIETGLHRLNQSEYTNWPQTRYVRMKAEDMLDEFALDDCRR